MHHALSDSQADKAYNIMRSSITDGRLLPGQKLSRRAMARLTGVSVIPVIEALHRLEHDGLVHSQAHWGSAVVRFDDEQFRSYGLLREAIECQVARELCGTLTAAQILHLREIAQKLDRELYRDTDHLAGDDHSEAHQATLELHHQFHLQMAELTGCAPLIGTLRKINLFNFLKHVVAKNTEKKDLPDNWHECLVDALAADDIAAAEQLFRTHVHSSYATDTSSAD